MLCGNFSVSEFLGLVAPSCDLQGAGALFHQEPLDPHQDRSKH